MDDTKLNELKRLARDATPGPWELSENATDAVIVKDEQPWRFASIESSEYYGGNLICESATMNNRAFIAAANPDVVLELIAALRLAKAALKEHADLITKTVEELPSEVQGKFLKALRQQ